MDNETLHIARLIALPELANGYTEFGDQITDGLVNPALQAIYETWRKTPSRKNSAEENIDGLTEATLSRLRSPGETTLRTKSGEKITTTAAKICAALENLRHTAIRMETLPQEAKSSGEESFRSWLERSIVQKGATAEPNYLAAADPLALALEKLKELKGKRPIFEGASEDIVFPLASYHLSSKPKTPTAIEPFDMEELEGGAEEDTTLILSGESNIGKSHLGLFSLSSLSLRREAVLLCSGEDSAETTRKRIFAHYLRRPAKDVIAMSETDRLDAFRGLYGHEEDPESLHYHIIRHVAIACIPEGAFTPQKILEKIDSVEQKTQKKIKAFMGDYLQKMNENVQGKNNRRQRDEELEFVVNQIKEICQTRKTFGIIISQVPSHAAGGQQEFLNLRQAVARSYAATWGAHHVITMNRTADETRRLASATNDKRPRLNLFLCKNKDGPLGVCYTLGYPNEARWEFFRDKAAMEREIESQKIQCGQIDIQDYRKR